RLAGLGLARGWRRAQSLDVREPVVNSRLWAYENRPSGDHRPVSDILVRVPGGDTGFGGDRYKVLARDYDRDKRTCGPDHTQRCTLADQLLDPDTLVGLGNGYDDPDQTPPEWRYYAPGDRLADWISPNTGDIVLLGKG